MSNIIMIIYDAYMMHNHHNHNHNHHHLHDQTLAHCSIEVTFLVTDKRFSPVSLHSCPSTMQSEMLVGKLLLRLINKNRRERKNVDFSRMRNILGWRKLFTGTVSTIFTGIPGIFTGCQHYLRVVHSFIFLSRQSKWNESLMKLKKTFLQTFLGHKERAPCLNTRLSLLLGIPLGFGLPPFLRYNVTPVSKWRILCLRTIKPGWEW